MVKKALQFVGQGKYRVESYDQDEQPKNNEVLIKVGYTGICGSDIHWLFQGSLGHFPLVPGVYGHESSGIIIATGSNVDNFNVGDRVCVEPCFPCWICDLCRKGSNNLCLHADTNSVSCGRSGFFRATNAWPAILCHKLADNMSLQEGALVEPTACAIWGLKRARLEGRENVLVTGCGPMGLLTIMVANAYGVNKILATDVNPKRLKLASKAGADYSLVVNQDQSCEQLIEEVKNVLGEPDVTFECSGAESCINLGIMGTKRGGKLVLVGLGRPKVSVALSTASLRQVDLVGVARYNNTFPEAIELISSGKVDTKLLISHIMELNQADDAFETLKDGNGVKILFKCSDLR